MNLLFSFVVIFLLDAGIAQWYSISLPTRMSRVRIALPACQPLFGTKPLLLKSDVVMAILRFNKKTATLLLFNKDAVWHNNRRREPVFYQELRRTSILSLKGCIGRSFLKSILCIASVDTT